MIGVEADRYPDTGSLRGDLIAQACAKGGLGEDLPDPGLRRPAGLAAPRPRAARGHHDPPDRRPRWRSRSRPSAPPSSAGRSARTPICDMLARLLPAISHPRGDADGHPPVAGAPHLLGGQRRPPRLRRDAAARLTPTTAGSPDRRSHPTGPTTSHPPSPPDRNPPCLRLLSSSRLDPGTRGRAQRQGPAPGHRPDHHHGRPAHGRARRHHREHRDAAHHGRPRLHPGEPLVGRHGLHPRLRWPAAPRRPPR